MAVIVDLHCWGNIRYWHHWVQHAPVVVEQHDHFQKRGFKNRYQILSAQGVLTLSVPVAGGRGTRGPVKEVLIDPHPAWQRDHWRTITACYNRSAFFFYYRHRLEPLYTRTYKHLWDFNTDVCQTVTELLALKTDVCYTDAYTQHSHAIDARNEGTTGTRHLFDHTPYYQIFGTVFEKNLCILDLLCNIGPQSLSYLAGQFPVHSSPI